MSVRCPEAADVTSSNDTDTDGGARHAVDSLEHSADPNLIWSDDELKAWVRVTFRLVHQSDDKRSCLKQRFAAAAGRIGPEKVCP